MRERAFVHVTGPSGCGKTTFSEAVLSRARRFLIAARCIRDDSLQQARETAPRTIPELRRYREAGASGVALFAFPESDIGTDYSEGVILEGDNPDLRRFLPLDVRWEVVRGELFQNSSCVSPCPLAMLRRDLLNNVRKRGDRERRIPSRSASSSGATITATARPLRVTTTGPVASASRR
jgi:hypothetical protein